LVDHPGGLRPPPLLIRGGESNVAVIIFSSFEEGKQYCRGHLPLLS